MLIDEIRQAGAVEGATPSAVAASAKSDPAMKELVDEIVRLSVEFGILTEYTAFLAREGTDLNRRNEILAQANRNLVDRAHNARIGQGAVNQAINTGFQRSQLQLNRRNYYFDENLDRVQVTRVQQVNDRAFFQNGNRWIDGQAINDRAGTEPDRVVTVGSPEFMELFEQLAAQNRQGTITMPGEILLRVGDQNVLVKGD